MSAVDRSYIVYLLDNTDNARTYVGCTNNPARRLRQHRQEIKGGAKATRGVFSWRYVWNERICTFLEPRIRTVSNLLATMVLPSQRQSHVISARQKNFGPH